MTVLSEYLVRPPHPALRDVVISYTGFAERAPAPVAFTELPCSHVPVIVDLAEGWTIADPRAPARPPLRRGSFVPG